MKVRNEREKIKLKKMRKRECETEKVGKESKTKSRKDEKRK